MNHTLRLARISIPTLSALCLPLLAGAHETDSFYLEEALVHHLKPETVTEEFPVIMVPGLNLSSSIYLATPDGRPGWARQFADAGFEVYVVNDPRFDFSRGFRVAGFTDVPGEGAPASNPDARQAWGQDIWRRWGFGTSEGNPYPDSKFPTDFFDEFEANYPWLSSAARTSFDQSIAALLKQVGPAVLMAHSAGGPKAVNAAKTHPERIAGLILVEPTGPPTASDFPTLKGMSMLGIYADHIDSRGQTGRKNATLAAAKLFEQNGGSGRIIDLPQKHGVHGNSHLMMQDTNNQFIAELILDWIESDARVPAEPGKPNPGGGAAGGMGGKAGMKSGGKGGMSGGKGGMIDAIFAQLDSDKDGALDFSEFKNGRRYRGADSSDVKEAFQDADADRDGKVTPEELGGAGVTAGRRGGKGRTR